MSSDLTGYTNHLEYMINVKLQTQIPEDLRWDIMCALHNYAQKELEFMTVQRNEWRHEALRLYQRE